MPRMIVAYAPRHATGGYEYTRELESNREGKTEQEIERKTHQQGIQAYQHRPR